MKKKYEDMTPEEQFEFRLTDSAGTYTNGRLMKVVDDDEPEDAKQDAIVTKMVRKDAFNEADHPRGEDGKFGKGTSHHIDQYEKVGEKLGSNPGGVYKHKTTGEKHYVKFSKSDQHAHNEVTASKLYQLANSPVVDQNLIDTGNGKKGTISKWQDIKPINQHDPNDRKDVHKHFGTHVWLSNWDAAGLSYDNQGRDAEGNMKTLDVGGALKYRAQGGEKGAAFGDKPTEHKTLRDTGKNPQTSYLFHDMDDKTEKHSYMRIKDIPDARIKEVVDKYAHPDDKESLLATLLARKKNLGSD